VMVEALHSVGHLATRNRGTIGGSLAHLDPAAELPGVCALHDATLTVTGPRGTRTVAMADWGISFMTPNVEPDEVLTGVSLKTWREPYGHAFVELARRQGDFAMAGVGCLIALDASAKVRRIALAVIGVTSMPVRLPAAEKSLTGTPVSDESIRAAAAEIERLEALDDAHASAAYRKRLASVLLGRAVRRAVERARKQGGRQ
jgi:aerobic carbon-monoxide dehydrogenase medium subunit